jgi:hypothetical protein
VEIIPVGKDKRGGIFEILMNYTCGEKHVSLLQFSLSLSLSRFHTSTLHRENVFVFPLHRETLTAIPSPKLNQSLTNPFSFSLSLKNRTTNLSPKIEDLKSI